MNKVHLPACLAMNYPQLTGMLLAAWLVASTAQGGSPQALGAAGQAKNNVESTAPVATPGFAAPHQLADSQAGPASLPAAENSADSPETVSVAEQITRLQKAMETDSQRLGRLRAEIVGPMSEYRLAEAAYKAIEDEVATKTEELACLRGAGDQEALVALGTVIEELTGKRALARERFDLAIETRKTLQAQIAALEAKQKQDQQALDKLTGDAPIVTEVAESPPPAAPAPPAKSEGTLAPATSSLVPLDGALGSISVQPPKAASQELVNAESDAQLKKEAADIAERDAQSVSQRIAALDKDIELENKLLIAARKKSNLAYQAGQAAEAAIDKGLRDGATPSEQQELQRRQRESSTLFRAARTEVEERTDRLNTLQTQRAELHREELAALTAAKTRQQEAEVAERKVSQLKNPFAANNVLQWLIDHSPKIGMILLAMLVLRWVVSAASHRVVSLMIMRGARGTRQEREDRARTLVGVFHNAVSVTLVISGVLMICEEVGIAVGPLMGGAAVLGLAVAFGAQNLIRDYFYGFVILLENQYKLNDVLRIGDISGQVEQITLRMTVLRDLEGNVHFIPNGKIDSVTNMTHGWSRAVIEVAVPYRENTDRVMDLLLDVAKELRGVEAFRGQIIDDPEMLGVENLGDSAVTIKFMIKTRPASKWAVKRELLRRIKARFDALGISAPFPQRVLHHQRDVESPSANERLLEEQEWPRKKSA